MSLLEVLIATVILLISMVAIAAGLTQYAKLVKFNQERAMALNAAQGILEGELNLGFNGILSNHLVPDGGAAPATPLVPAANNPLGALPFAASASIDVKDVDGRVGSVNVVEIRVAVCWRSTTGALIGEDNGAGGGLALNGVLDGAEDANGNNLMDSPTVVVTRVAEGS